METSNSLRRGGKSRLAFEIYTILTNYAFVSNSKWFFDVYGQIIEKEVQELSQDERESARLRANSLTPRKTAKTLCRSLNNE